MMLLEKVLTMHSSCGIELVIVNLDSESLYLSVFLKPYCLLQMALIERAARCREFASVSHHVQRQAVLNTNVYTHVYTHTHTHSPGERLKCSQFHSKSTMRTSANRLLHFSSNVQSSACLHYNLH